MKSVVEPAAGVLESSAQLTPVADLPGFALSAALTACRDQWRGEIEGLGDRCALAAGQLADSARAYRAQDRAAGENLRTAVGQGG